MMTGSRVFFAMADRGLFFHAAARVSPRFNSPAVAIWLATALGVAYVLGTTSRSWPTSSSSASGPSTHSRCGRVRVAPPASRAAGRIGCGLIRWCPAVFLLASGLMVLTRCSPTRATPVLPCSSLWPGAGVLAARAVRAPALILQPLVGALREGLNPIRVRADAVVLRPVLGNLSDRFGRRPVLLFALLALGCDYLACAPVISWLFVGAWSRASRGLSSPGLLGNLGGMPLPRMLDLHLELRILRAPPERLDGPGRVGNQLRRISGPSRYPPPRQCDARLPVSRLPARC